MYTNAEQAIADSIRENKIVHLSDHNSQIAVILQRDCDDSVVNGDVTEYWGTIEDGSEWRVHMAAAPSDQEITKHDIKRLAAEASEAGDDEQFALCVRALGDKDPEAIAECERVIREARARASG